MTDRLPEGYSIITPEEAHELIEKGGVAVIDVREPDDFAQGRVKGAVNVPLGLITPGRILPEAPDTEQTVLVYCRSGRRSDTAGRIMAQSGYSDVRNFLGVIQWPFGLEK